MQRGTKKNRDSYKYLGWKVEAELLGAIDKFIKEKEELRNEIKRSYAENVELQNKYDNLQVAQALISLSNKDVARAKAKLTTMMKTIDRCVEKINDDSHE